MRCALWITVAGLALASALPARGDDSKNDIEALQGTWHVVSITDNGKAIYDNEDLNMRLIFTSDIMRMIHPGDGTMQLKVALDATKKPRAMDLIFQEDGGEDKIGVYIYKIEGDKLTLCATNDPDPPRPTKFESAKGSDVVLIVLQRAKDSKKDGAALQEPPTQWEFLSVSPWEYIAAAAALEKSQDLTPEQEQPKFASILANLRHPATAEEAEQLKANVASQLNKHGKDGWIYSGRLFEADVYMRPADERLRQRWTYKIPGEDLLLGFEAQVASIKKNERTRLPRQIIKDKHALINRIMRHHGKQGWRLAGRIGSWTPMIAPAPEKQGTTPQEPPTEWQYLCVDYREIFLAAGAFYNTGVRKTRQEEVANKLNLAIYLNKHGKDGWLYTGQLFELDIYRRPVDVNLRQRWTYKVVTGKDLLLGFDEEVEKIRAQTKENGLLQTVEDIHALWVKILNVHGKQGWRLALSLGDWRVFVKPSTAD